MGKDDWDRDRLDQAWFKAYNDEASKWKSSYGRKTKYVSDEDYKEYGKPITISQDVIYTKSHDYKEKCQNIFRKGILVEQKRCSVDLVARVVFAEICDLAKKRDNAFAVAQVIYNRVKSPDLSFMKFSWLDGITSYNNPTVRIVTAKSQFSCINDGNGIFLAPYKNFTPDAWAVCVWLAGCLVEGDDIPKLTDNDIGNRLFFYDTNWGQPKGIIKDVITIGTHIYFNR